MSPELLFRLIGFFLIFMSVVSLSLALRDRFARYRSARAASAGPVGPAPDPKAVRAENARRLKRDGLAGLAHVSRVIGFIIGAAGHGFSIMGRLPIPGAGVFQAIGFGVFLLGTALLTVSSLLGLGRRLFKVRPRLYRSFFEIAPLVSLLFIGLTGLVYSGALAGAGPESASALPDWPLIAARLSHSASIAVFLFLFARTNLMHVLLASRATRLGVPPVSGGLRAAEEAVNRMFAAGGGAEAGGTAAETIGLAGAAGFSPGERLRIDNCVGCGFCDSVCPAVLSGKSLSPSRLIQSQRRAIEKEAKGKTTPFADDAALVKMTEECAMCYACESACPLAVDKVDKIAGIRRHLVLQHGRAPAAWKTALRNLEKGAGVFGDAKPARRAYAAELGLPFYKKGMKVSFVLWFGCYALWDQNMKPVLRSLARLLADRGFKAAVLEDEPCCGEMARRIGDEYRFQELARRNIELFRGLGTVKLLTVCPHCLNTFRKEYPELGGAVDAVHYLEILDDLVPAARERGGAPVRRAVYHDSCYLGRLSGLYDAPRRSLADAGGGIELIALRDERENALCCGGGGGRILLEEEKDKRASLLKVREAAALGADLLVTSCPYCLGLYKDAAATLGSRVEVKDLLEVVGA